MSDLDILVVGPCASGKSTLVRGLRDKGYAGARQVAQEHSGVRNLWSKRGRPQVLIYLDARFETMNLRQKRMDWTQALLDEQHARLDSARRACDLYLPTDELAIAEVLETVIDFLQRRDSRSSLP